MENDNDTIVLMDKMTTGFTLSWNNIGYSVPTKDGGRKQILFNVNGIAKPGNLIAILGASGAGKSTLLDVLSGRKNKNNVTGKVLVNGRADIQLKHVAKYCTQEDALFGNLTVFETLMYAARFSLPKSYSDEKRTRIVLDLIQEFGLESVKNTIIGTPLLKGCSGGQKRRVSVASQIIGADDGIIFLDEPTSGLDSVAASSLVTTLKTVAQKGATIMATIHQPSSETFELFTHVFIIGAGSTVYFGPREDAIAYFASINRPIPSFSNPSDIYLQMTNIDFSEDKEAQREVVKKLIVSYNESSIAQNMLAEINDQKPGSDVGIKYGFSNGFVYQTQILFKRAILNAVKNPLSYWIRVIMYIGLAILMGTTWLRMGVNQSTVQDRLGAIFFSIAFLAFMSVAGIPAFLEERHVFLREVANGLYGIESYVLSNFLVSIPFVFIIAISFSIVVYFLMNFQSTGDKFFTFVGYLFLSLMAAESQTMLVAVSIPIFVAALTIGSFANGLWMVVQGYFVQKKNIPGFWKYSFHYINFQKYGFESLLKNEFSGLTFDCAPQGNSCFCSIPPANPLATPCKFTGDDVINFFEYNDVNYRDWAIILIAIIAFFKLATYAVLKMRGSKSS